MEAVADSFFARTTKAIRDYDPNHLIISNRFVGTLDDGKFDLAPIMRIASKYCDVIAVNLYAKANENELGQAAEAMKNLYNSLPLVGMGQSGPEGPPMQKRPILITEFAFHADGNSVVAENWGRFESPYDGWDGCWPARPNDKRCANCPVREGEGCTGPFAHGYPNVSDDAARGSSYERYVNNMMNLKAGPSTSTDPAEYAHLVPGYFWYGIYDHPLLRDFNHELPRWEYGSTQGWDGVGNYVHATQNWGLLKTRTNQPATEGGLWDTVGDINSFWQSQIQGYSTGGETCIP